MSDGTTIPAWGRFLFFVVVISILAVLFGPVIQQLGAFKVIP